MASQIQLRRSTLAEWAAANPVLLSGEIGIATDIGLFKIGNGSGGWNLLKWASRSGFVIPHAVTNGGYTVLDNDGYEAFLFSTGASDRTLTLPTLADNIGRRIRLTKTDSGAGKAIMDGEGTQKIGAEGNALTFDLYAQGDWVEVEDAGTYWAVVGTNGPLLIYASASDVAGSNTGGVWANPAGHSLAVPAGVWEPSAKVVQSTARVGGNTIKACLSTANDSASDADMISVLDMGAGVNSMRATHRIERAIRLVLSVSATYYLNIFTANTATANTTLGATDTTTDMVMKRVG